MKQHRLRTKILWALVTGLSWSSAQPQATIPSSPSNNSGQVGRLYSQGRQLAAEGRLAEAEEPLQKALSLTPHDTLVLTLLGKVKARLGESANAALLFKRVVEVDQGSADAHLNLAIALADAEDPSGALEETARAIQLAPQDPAAHLTYARLLADSGRIIEAQKEFSTACRLDPQNRASLFLWASFELTSHRPKTATLLFQRVVSSEPQNYRAYFLLGKSLEAENRKEEAIAAWRHSIAINPDYQEAVYTLSQALRNNEPAAAAQLLIQFKELQVKRETLDQVRNLGNQAYAAMQSNDWDSAVITLRQGLKLCQSCELEADLHQHLGLAEAHRGDLENGETELLHALALNPDDRVTVQALQWITAQQKKRTRSRSEKDGAPIQP